MFEHLGGFERVLVTGPQRSGTRICAKMIARDTDLRFVDEREFCVDSLNRLWKLLQDETGIVVQCPALCRYVHHLVGCNDAVVFMKRRLVDIKMSEQRIGWDWELPELMRYSERLSTAAETKLDFWWCVQALEIDHPFEVAYENLNVHPLWIPKEQRTHFDPYQTE
jgi:hypothetical protein